MPPFLHEGNLGFDRSAPGRYQGFPSNTFASTDYRLEKSMDWKLFFATFGTIFVAELGDKTQLACILMAAKTQKPVTVFFATAAALVLVSLLGVLLASIIYRYVPEQAMRKVAAFGFISLGVLIWFDKL